MNHSINKLLLLFALLFCQQTQAQIKELLDKTITAISDTASAQKIDTALYAITQELQQSKLNERNLQMELEQAKFKNIAADSIKLQKQKLVIDSLRAITVGFPVIIGKDTLFTFYTNRVGLSAKERAAQVSKTIESIGKQFDVKIDSVHIYPGEFATDIMYLEKPILSLTDLDAMWENMTRAELAEKRKKEIVLELKGLQEEFGLMQLIKRILLFTAVIIGQFFLYKLTVFLFRKLRQRILKLKDTTLKPVKIGDYEFLDTARQVRVLILGTQILRTTVVLLQLLITVPMLFSIFPQTENVAFTIISYVSSPIKKFGLAFFHYIPNIFTIVIIWIATKYVTKGIRYLANEIKDERLQIAGFYPDWAIPTYNILRFLCYAFMIAIIYPYLPGADSAAFQGITIFIGLIGSLGSSTVIANIVAGMVLTYMRPFKIGDRISYDKTIGNVIEKTPFVTRIRTQKNEIITIPNSFIMSANTTNLSASARDYGLIIHSTVSCGHDVPWRKVHDLLIKAMLQTEGVVSDPQPFVLELSIEDFYVVYQANAYIKEANKLAAIYSCLHQNVIDVLSEAGIDITTPHHQAIHMVSEVPK